jgi:actin cytoskeleton-regulatory complex protein PAN1
MDQQILHHPTEMAQDRKEVETSLDMAQKILNNINDTIREQEGRERLKEISKHLWIGTG